MVWPLSQSPCGQLSVQQPQWSFLRDPITFTSTSLQMASHLTRDTAQSPFPSLMCLAPSYFFDSSPTSWLSCAVCFSHTGFHLFLEHLAHLHTGAFACIGSSAWRALPPLPTWLMHVTQFLLLLWPYQRGLPWPPFVNRAPAWSLSAYLFSSSDVLFILPVHMFIVCPSSLKCQLHENLAVCWLLYG